MKYLVTIVAEENRMDIAGIFDTQEKADKAMALASDMMKERGRDDYAIYIIPCEENRFAWNGTQTIIQ